MSAICVIAIFGPTASGKTAVAEALADRLPGEVVSADAMQVYRGLAILTNQSERPSHLTAIWPLGHEGSVAEYQRLAHAAVDDIAARGLTPVVAGGNRALPARGAFRPRPAARARAPGRASGSRRSTTSSAPTARTRSSPSATPRRPRRCIRTTAGASSARSSSRSPARRSAAARTGSGPDDTRHPTLLVGLDVPKEELERRIEARTAAMWERGVEAEVAAALTEPISPTAATIFGLREVAELPPGEARERDRAPDAPDTPRISGNGCAASRTSLRLPPTGLRPRSPMTSSNWHALGNAYLVLERAGRWSGRSTSPTVRELSADTDGIVEIVEERGAEADVQIWNPDGSQAEFSGNGARIAARVAVRANRAAGTSACISAGARRPLASRGRPSRWTSAPSTSVRPRSSTSATSASSSHRSRSAIRMP